MPVSRPRLTALLAEPALTSVELVVAPPGYGKTTVLRDYAAGDPGARIVGLPEKADLEAFVRGIVGIAAPGTERAIGALFADPEARGFEERVVDWLTGRLRDFDGTLILDDFHRAAGDERVARVLAAVVAATHGRMRWIVASREAPRLPMGSWIARGWMGLPLTSEDLRFTPGEAAALAMALGIAAGPDDVARVVDDTLGWPIGVRLALGLLVRKHGASQTRVQTREALFALIDEEIWQPLEPQLQRMIAASALMPEPTVGTLLAAGFADARSALAATYARVPFVQPRDDDAFTIHDLFREFVTTRYSAPGGEAALLIGAALVDGGNAADGLRLLVAAGRAADVATALAGHAFDLLETGHRTLVAAAVKLLTEHGLGDGGITLAIRGALAFAGGSGANSANLFARALERDVPPGMRSEIARRLAVSYVNAGDAAKALAVLGSITGEVTTAPYDRLENEALALVCNAASGAGDRAALEASLPLLEQRLASVPPNVQVRVLQRLGSGAFYMGDLESAERLGHDCALLATELGMDTYAALAYGTLYSIAGQSDAGIARARNFARSQAAAAERAADSSLRVFALRAQFAIAAEDAALGEAQVLEETIAGLVDARAYRDTAYFRHARALCYVVSKELDKADATLRSVPATALSHADRAQRDAFLALILLLRGKRADAAELLERALLHEASHDFYSQMRLAYAAAFRGLAFWALDRPAQARRAFDFDLTDLGARERILLETLKAFAALPHPLPNGSAVDALGAALAGAGFGAYAELLRGLAARDANDVELSAAEIETLRVFDRYGGRAVDVAKALGKSKYTVQNQIQSAIKKLGCSGRAEALAYARRRGWLDPTTS